MKNKWKAIKVADMGDKPFTVARKRFNNQPLHSGNIEYAGDEAWFESRIQAQELAHELNVMEETL